MDNETLGSQKQTGHAPETAPANQLPLAQSKTAPADFIPPAATVSLSNPPAIDNSSRDIKRILLYGSLALLILLGLLVRLVMIDDAKLSTTKSTSKPVSPLQNPATTSQSTDPAQNPNADSQVGAEGKYCTNAVNAALSC